MPVELTCERCGEEYSVSPSRSDSRFCSSECRYADLSDPETKHPGYEGGKVALTCEHCEGEFEVFPNKQGKRKYCSKQCHSDAMRKCVSLECDHCGESYQKPPSHAEDSRFCSATCKAEGMKEQEYPERRNRVVSECNHCGSEFERPASHGLKFCSRECHYASEKPKNYACDNCGQRIRVMPCKQERYEQHYCSDNCMREDSKNGCYENCVVCGKEFWVTPHQKENGRGKCCSRKCADENKPSGADHHSWQGGGLHYYGANWHEMRRVVRNRDCFRCRKCGMHEDELGTELHVHHIVPIREFDEPEDANTPNNLVTVCPSCHNEVEGDVEAGRALL